MSKEKLILDKHLGMKSYFNVEMENKIISAMKENADRVSSKYESQVQELKKEVSRLKAIVDAI